MPVARAERMLRGSRAVPKNDKAKMSTPPAHEFTATRTTPRVFSFITSANATTLARPAANAIKILQSIRYFMPRQDRL